MKWLVFVACIKFQATLICTDNYGIENEAKIKECILEIEDCTFDGEDLRWCAQIEDYSTQSYHKNLDCKPYLNLDRS